MTPRPADTGDSRTAPSAKFGEPDGAPPSTDPHTVGEYRILAVLGEGGTARVFLGSGPDGSLVAVRRALPSLALDDEFRNRFAREATAARRASGARIPPVIDADTEADVPWMATQFVPGPTLAQTLDALGPLSERSSLRLAAGLATALADLVREGVELPEIKPSHVILAADGVRLVHGLSEASTTLAETMHDLGATLSTAATGKADTIDLSAAPPAVRTLVKSCVHGDPDQRPRPKGLLEAIGTVAPAIRPWPHEVEDLASAQRAALDRLIRSASESTTRLDLGATLIDDFQADILAARGRSSSRRARRRYWAIGTALVLVAAIGLTLLL